MTLLTKQQILGADDIVRKTVPVPEWTPQEARERGEVHEVAIRSLMGYQREEFDEHLANVKSNKKKHSPGLLAKVVAMHCVDERDEPLFTAADLEALSRKSEKALNRVFAECLRLSSLDERAVEDEVKNLPSGQSEDSGSTSASDTDAPSENSSSA